MDIPSNRAARLVAEINLPTLQETVDLPRRFQSAFNEKSDLLPMTTKEHSFCRICG